MRIEDDRDIYSSSGGFKKRKPHDQDKYLYRPQRNIRSNRKAPNGREDFSNDEFQNLYNEVKTNRRRPTKREMSMMRQKSVGKKKKMSILKRIMLVVFVLILAFVGLIIGMFFYYFGGLKTDKTFTNSPQELGLSSSKKIDDRVTNIALFGVDSRDSKENGRSDTTMVASFDGIHHQIKLTSLLRDSRVNIDGHGKDKLCHAYSYGGPKLAVKTINQNYKLDIMEYITVNFSQMAQIIDAIDGLDLTLTQKERDAANGLINSTPDLKYSEFIEEFDGNQATLHLNGAQAVSYARIRKIDSEVQRVGRQQIVLQAVFDKITKAGFLQYPKLIKNLLPYVDTSLSYRDLLLMLPTIIASKNTIRDYNIPDAKDKEVFGGNVNGVWYWVYDLDKYASKLYDFIYNQG